MNKQPEALRLTQHMEDEWPEDWDGPAIRAELRRLHEVNAELLGALNAASLVLHPDLTQYKRARAAITKATGEQA